jgi:hypothetical protein
LGDLPRGRCGRVLDLVELGDGLVEQPGDVVRDLTGQLIDLVRLGRGKCLGERGIRKEKESEKRTQDEPPPP